MGITLRHLWELIETSITDRESFPSGSCGVLVMRVGECNKTGCKLGPGPYQVGPKMGLFSEKGRFCPFLGPGQSCGMVVELRRQPTIVPHSKKQGFQDKQGHRGAMGIPWELL